MRRYLAGITAMGGLLWLSGPCFAGSLGISPVIVDVAAPGAAAAITVRNLGTQPASTQLRIFRWLQVNGNEELVETRDVAVSPPFAAIAPNSEQVLRVIRTSKEPIAGEESYRLLVDELPDRSRKTWGTVRIVVRSSIPVFFGPPAQKADPLQWSVEKLARGLRLTAVNTSGGRVRLSNLRLSDDGGKTLHLNNGLAGYVLGRSSRVWSLRASTPNALPSGSRIMITATGNQGPIHGEAILRMGK
ncbi:MAG: molecular chaperone [Beijerinckiaceae bacterium]|nr:molecular chaperone [Beijerinckiaceae bacterium]MCI0747359.1 molecular chaperone [Limisphaerales bacterium]